MTRFDLYIRRKLLDSMALSYLELTPNQEAILSRMIDETYVNEQFAAMSIEDRIACGVKQFRSRMYTS